MKKRKNKIYECAVHALVQCTHRSFQTNDKKVPFGAQKRHSVCRLSKGSINSPAQTFQNLLQDQTMFPSFQNILFYQVQ
jgi:hypothetical protein